MADLPEDDGPTMTGVPGDRHVKDVPVPEGDTTDATLKPPESEAKEAHDEEDRTVQQKVSPPMPARKPAEVTAPPPVDPPTSPRAPPASAAASAIPSTEPSKIPSTEPSKGAAPPPVLPPVLPPAVPPPPASTRTPAIEDDDEVEDKTSIDALAAADDSITATAPSLASMKLPLVTTGTVQIRNLGDDEDEDDAGDATEVRPRPGLVPINVPATTRAALGPQPSQPPPPPRPAAGRPAPNAPNAAKATNKDAAPLTVASATASTAVAAIPPPPDDDEDEGVTRQAVAPRVGDVPDIGPPMTAVVPVLPASVLPATDRSATGASGPASEPAMPTRPGVSIGRGSSSILTIAGEPATQPGLDLPTRPGHGAGDASKNSYANEDDEDNSDESITKRGPVPLPAKHAKPAASAASPLEDSVTAQAPNVPPELVAAATASSRAKIQSDPTLEEGVGDTTKRVQAAAPHTRTVVSASVSPADGESDSVTAQAPLTNNILRVAATAEPPPKEASDEPLEEEEPEENRTAVMANAPLKRILAEIAGPTALPPIRPTGPNVPTNMGPMGAAAPRLQADSESGLRIARGSSSDERGSFGMPTGPEARPSGIARSAAGSENRLIVDVHGQTDLAMPNFTHGQPSLHDGEVPKGPHYGLLVAIVAVISLLVPMTLFFALNRGPEATPPPEPAEAVSEIEKPDPPRGKAERRNGITVSPTPSGSASGKGRGSLRR